MIGLESIKETSLIFLLWSTIGILDSLLNLKLTPFNFCGISGLDPNFCPLGDCPAEPLFFFVISFPVPLKIVFLNLLNEFLVLLGSLRLPIFIDFILVFPLPLIFKRALLFRLSLFPLSTDLIPSLFGPVITCEWFKEVKKVFDGRCIEEFFDEEGCLMWIFWYSLGLT